ncbi:hypothetical protein LTR37_015505 [Vermiconidia calcicola]|uniref:Uncharacterized protein n=1 Tax=Vermiconidia calcicola TaxID=1690605 RepID=A0ACC3MQK2_9PEZI|nr:hypothetical protein LTR37_015505 [Vermiconidia calcicola]
MANLYNDAPVLFLNSNGAAFPSGRNARAHYRARETSTLAPSKAQGGHFEVFAVDPKRQSTSNSRTPRKRRKQASGTDETNSGNAVQRLSEHRKIAPHPSLSSYLRVSDATNINPSDVLAVATFHIRRIAAMTIHEDPGRLSEVLRCRQWSSVYLNLSHFGTVPCLDSALLCVAAKVRQMTGETSSPLVALSSYSEALLELQNALKSPEQHDSMDLLTTTRMLAVYEMLDSLENPTWAKHLAGAASLAHSQVIVPRRNGSREELTFAQIAPLLTDALLTGDDDAILERYRLQSLLQAFMAGYSPSSTDSRILMSYLLDLLELISAAKTARQLVASRSQSVMHGILDRAQNLKTRLRKELLRSDLAMQRDDNAHDSYDRLAMGLAALVALDRLITSLRPAHHDMHEDKTSELCAQLLQLNLGATEGAAQLSSYKPVL